ncbi:MAG: hypothetical protein ACLQGP_26095 [Isosphaeraceae bacterium]
MIRAPVLLVRLALILLATAATAHSQEEPPTVVEIVLRPAPAPMPALKYRILPERGTLIHGNAAIFYHRAIEMIWAARRRAASSAAKEKGQPHDAEEQAASEWISGPLASIPLDRAHRWLDQHRSVLREVELGARRRDCDWGFESRPDGIDLQISEIQDMRSLARLVTLRVRVAVLEKKPDEAIYWLQTGYAMGRHVSQGPILVQSLVGIATCAILSRATEDVIQMPGMPSLYWALANRPHPFIDLAPALEGERFLLEHEIPQLRELEGIPWSVEKGRAFTDELQAKLFRFAGMGSPAPAGSGAPEMKDWSKKLGVAALVAQAYPEARRALIAQGMPSSTIEAMPTVQVAALYTFRSYQGFRDDVFKWMGLPYYQAYLGMDSGWRNQNSELHRRPLLKLFAIFLSSVQSSYLATARLDRQLDTLQCIEAIRLHAATHQGLPDRLEDIKEAPAPLDPMTGQPFGYRLDGDRAILTATYAPGAPRIPHYALHYELKLAR